MAAITVCSDLEMVILYQIHTNTYRASLIIQSVKNLPAVQEMQVRFLVWEDQLGKEMATHTSILAWEIPCLLLGRKAYDQSRQHIKKQTHYSAKKGQSSQSYGFSNSHIWI